MREILFRGFNEDKDGKEKAFYGGKWHKGVWAEGCYFMAKDYKYNILHCISEIKGEKIFKVVHETVGQYTGLPDKNKKKIFTNDVVKCVSPLNNINYIGVVKFGEYKTNGHHSHCGFYVKWISNKHGARFIEKSLSYLCHIDLEVIGNIHSNPEILEVE